MSSPINRQIITMDYINFVRYFILIVLPWILREKYKLAENQRDPESKVLPTSCEFGRILVGSRDPKQLESSSPIYRKPERREILCPDKFPWSCPKPYFENDSSYTDLRMCLKCDVRYPWGVNICRESAIASNIFLKNYYFFQQMSFRLLNSIVVKNTNNFRKTSFIHLDSPHPSIIRFSVIFYF